MEKIFTKIGDVTIERRVSKPKISLETSYGSNTDQVNHSLPNFPSGIPKLDELSELSGFAPSIKPHITITSKNRVFNVDGNIDCLLRDSSSKPETSRSKDFGCNFSSTETTLNFDSNLKCLQNKNQNKEIETLKINESGVSLPKVPRIAAAEDGADKYEPDLSKFTGISIVRKRKVEIESQPKEILSSEPKTEKESDNAELSTETSIENKSTNDSSERILGNQEKNSEEKLALIVQKNNSDLPLCDSIKTINKTDKSSENQRDDSLQNDSSNKQHDESDSEEVAVVEDVFSRIKKEYINKEEQDARDDKNKIENEEIVTINEVDERDEGKIKEEVEDELDIKDSDVNDLACTELVQLMQKGEIEGEIEDVKDEDIIEESTESKTNKRKTEDGDSEGDSCDNADSDEEEDANTGGSAEEEKKKSKKPCKKKKKSEKIEKTEEKGEGEEHEESKDGNIDKSKVTNANLRKNIREVMDETKLDEATLSAQRQEAERLKRLQEQQRIIREVQRQIALNRQSQKSQNKVFSLLQGNLQTSILKTSSAATQVQNSQLKSQNSVLVKLSNGEQTSLNNKKMIELIKNSKNKAMVSKPPIPKTLLKQGMVTPSVSIAPIAKKESVVDDKKKKKGDVVTLSSDSEDDCIVLSDEDESEPEEDPNNSGMHTNDKYNLLDDQGRVLVNVGHPDSEKDLYLAPQIAKIIKPHQIGGIRFLYDNVIESIDRFSTSTGFGCILAHSMGLGKTLQIVSFSDIFLRYTSAATILCIVPINTIQNWLAEFNMWLPKESTSEDVRCREFDLFIVNESLKNLNQRARVILDWKKSGGVLLMGYELFRLLSLKKSYKSKKKKRGVEEDDARNKELIEEVYSALVVPGPDLVICDEGHRIKNSHATTSQALKQIRTKRRIVLTGYPLQNNLLEYWCMVDFVRPNYLGTKTEFSNMFERPIQNGQCIDSTPQDKRLMRYRAHVLHSLLEGFVQRRSHAVLQSTLPEKVEYVLLLRFTPFQRKLYDTFMNEVVRTVAVPNPLKAFAVCCKIWNHPDVLYNFLKKKGEEIDLDLEEALPPSLQIPQYPYGQQTLQPEGLNQQTAPWPRRGPGSRGGKARQTNARKGGQNISGRKTAANISPCEPGEREKMTDIYTSEKYSGVTGEYPGKSFSNQSETMMNCFQGKNHNQNRFKIANEYNDGYGHSGYGKIPLNNMEEMSAGGFQGKQFFSRGSETGSQGHRCGGQGQNFDSGGLNANFNQTGSNESNLTASFESNIGSSSSAFNQSEPKRFDYGQDFNSSFYPNENFQSQGTNADYAKEKKPSAFQSNNSYFHNQNFGNAERFDYPLENSLNSNFPKYDTSQNTNYSHLERNTNFQSSMQRPDATQRLGAGSGESQASTFQNQTTLRSNFQDANFSGNFANSNISFDPNRFPRSLNAASNFQGSSESNLEVNRDKNFSGSSSNFNINRGNSFSEQKIQGNFQGSDYDETYWRQSSNWNYGESLKGNQNYRATSGKNDFVTSQQQQQQLQRPQQPEQQQQFQRTQQVQSFQQPHHQLQYQQPPQQQQQQQFQKSQQQHYQQPQQQQQFQQPIQQSAQQSQRDTQQNTQKFIDLEDRQDATKLDSKNCIGENIISADYKKSNCDYSSSSFEKTEIQSKMTNTDFEENQDIVKPKEDEEKKEEAKISEVIKKEDGSLPYDWATDLFKTYVTGAIENSSKMEVFFHIVTESIKLGDRLLVFSQSLLTLDLIESYLHRQNVPTKEEFWSKSRNYFRLDGSTPGLEREKLINEFNSNCNIHLFLVSTRAGSLGINLVGANRVVVFDASWNPCHDTQAVCRVYRYGQQKPCYVYRLVMDSCLEKKIYDRQVNKQGMADRVVDELNPDAHLSIKEVTNLCWDDQEDTSVKDFSDLKDKYDDDIIKILLDRCSKILSKEPFQHESLLIDRKEKKLSQAEKRLAKRSYELEKQAANQPKNIYTFFPNTGQRTFVKPIASVRPMQSEMNSRMSPQMQNRSKWISADVWQKQGMSAQEMTLPLDVVIPTSSPEKTSIVLKAGQKVMVLKSPKGIYMQLENGKIIAIRSAFKVNQNNSVGGDKHEDAIKKEGSTSVTSKLIQGIRQGIVKQPFPKPFAKYTEKKVPVNINIVKGRQVMGRAKPFVLNRKLENVTPDVKQRLISGTGSSNSQDDKYDTAEPTIVEEKFGQQEKTDSSADEGSYTEETVISSSDEKTEDKPEEKCKMADSLETLRKVTEKINDAAKKEPEVKRQHSSPIKSFHHNFTCQEKEISPVIEKKVKEVVNTESTVSVPPYQQQQPQQKQQQQQPHFQQSLPTVASSAGNASGNRTIGGFAETGNRASAGVEPLVTGSGSITGDNAGKLDKKGVRNMAGNQQGENLQNWLMNQSYPPMDPYGNYFPGYYPYGPGNGSVMTPYDGLYPSNNYGHSVEKNPSAMPLNSKLQPPDPSKINPPQQPLQPIPNTIPQSTAPPSRNQSMANTSSVYPSYPNPYSYHYPTNPNFGSQRLPLTNQNQATQQTTQSSSAVPVGNAGYGQPPTCDNSVYSAFHRPDAAFQVPDNPYSSPYPRPPYQTSGTPGFFSYNPPYPNYAYGHNFNPYMHPTGYGYPVQNHTAGVGPGTNASTGIGPENSAASRIS